ncbi:MAG TPA: NAD(P)/FAD-dependent oxidoreductase [Longimicrobium sp.]|jgi:thioredoxin reductase|uniref:NAD(P)/FAD-dependent oxidoreductase n=1 Tax=Longimicrobium sp. TaxID=2029185 RepID=UPI002ED824E3
MTDGGKYDVVVIGGGPAGLSGALWLARYRRTVRVFDAEDPRNAATWAVHGYPGLPEISPQELRETLRMQAKDAGAEYEAAVVLSVEGREDDFRVTLEDGRVFGARRLLLATGLKDIVPEIPGLEQFYGTSIWHCPDCDGPSVRDCKVGVIGWGRQIAAYCMYMLTFTEKITVLTHGHPPDMEQKARDALQRWNIPVREDVIDCLEGEGGRLRRAVFHDGGTEDFDAMFFHIASGPGASFAADIGCDADEDGILEIDKDHLTTVPGVYAAGDIVPGSRLAIRAAAEGVRAAVGIHKSLIGEDRRLR